MSVTLGHNQYGKAGTRVVRVDRDTAEKKIAVGLTAMGLAFDHGQVRSAR
jgi:hypothetical protein